MRLRRREVADYQRKDAGGHRVKGTEMPDRALAENAADPVDHVVRGQAGRFIDYEYAVHEDLVIL